MKKIKRAYYYFFYKTYKSIEYTSEQFGGAFWTDFKAGLAIIALEIWFILSLLNYYTIFTKVWFSLSLKKPIIFIPLLFIITINYLAFVHTDKWKEYNKEFNNLPKKINRKGGWIVFGISSFIVINMIFSFYLLYRMNRH